jgi:hypothetical protein
LLKKDDLNAHLLDVKAKDDSLKEDDKDVNNFIRVVHVINYIILLGDAMSESNTLDDELKY